MHNTDGIKQTLGRHRLPSVIELCDQCQHYFQMLVKLRMKADQFLTNPSKIAQPNLLIRPKWTFLCSVQSLAMVSVQGGQKRTFCCLGNEVGVRSNSKRVRKREKESRSQGPQSLALLSMAKPCIFYCLCLPCSLPGFVSRT